MNIALLQGSPNKTGSTALLCEQFTQGARASGHKVDRIDLAELSIAPCTGCVRCGYGAHPCVQHDDMSWKVQRIWARANLMNSKLP